MGFNIGSILAGAAMGATTSMRNRMDTHEKSLAETKRLRQSAEIQEEFTDKREKKKEDRQSERDAQALKALGYSDALIAFHLRGGAKGVDSATLIGMEASKNGYDVNTLYKSKDVTGSNIENDAGAINNIMSTVPSDGGSQTINAFSLDPDVMKQVYTVTATDKTLDAMLATTTKKAMKAQREGDEQAYVQAMSDQSSILLSIKNKHIATTKADKPYNAFGTISITTMFKETRNKNLLALNAISIEGEVTTIIDGSKYLQGMADVLTFQDLEKNNKGKDGKLMSDEFEALRQSSLLSGQKSLTDYASDPTNSNIFTEQAISAGETQAAPKSIFSYTEALQLSKANKLQIGQIIKIKGSEKVKRSNGDVVDVPGIFHFVWLGSGFNNRGTNAGSQIVNNFFNGAFYEDR
tara:strand:+ start:777 stop:2000 length:1224 start_codon:yes stop_codon:yes gene_type:complete